MFKKEIKNASYLILGASLLTACSPVKQEEERPNILWIILDDTGLDFSAYGNQLIETPVFDSLAAQGVLFTNMHVTSPVCSPSRSAMVTGMYQTSNGTHQHRSSRGDVMIFIDEDKPLIPELFQHEGYYTGNVGYDYEPKTDYNFIWNPSMYDASFRIHENNWVSPWAGRAEGQPFFIQIQLEGGKNRRVTGRYPVQASETSPAPYYPNDSLFYYDQASYHSSTLHVDKLLGDIVYHLKQEGLDQNTVIMILGDNGQDNYRDKQWLYQGGTHVPFVVAGPEKYIGTPGQVRDDLAIHIDMAPASLAMAGIKLPEYLEGVDLFSPDYIERKYIVTARDRCDWTVDRIRTILTKDYKYVRNYYPEKPYMQSNYRDEWKMVVRAKEMFANGELNDVQARFFQPTRPAEEFYILPHDRYEIDDQVNNPEYAGQIEKMRAILDDWIAKTGDHGEIPESEASYNEALKNVNTMGNTSFPLSAGPSALTLKNDTASYYLVITNLANKDLDVEIRATTTANLKTLESVRTIKVNGRTTERVDFRAHTPKADLSDSLVLNISTHYHFNPKSSHVYTWEYLLKPLQKKAIPQADVTIDGRLDDWEGLPGYTFGNTDQVRFGIAQNADYVFVGVEVKDDNVIAVPGRYAWQQDGIEIRIDGRSDPYRSSGIGIQDFTDHLLLALSPSESGKPVSMYLPAHAFHAMPRSFYENELKYVCKITPTGFVTEVAVPISYFNQLQDGEFNGLRLNVIVHNQSSETEKRVSWKPQWGSEGDFAGSGSFSR